MSMKTSNKIGFCEPAAEKVTTLRIFKKVWRLFGTLPRRRELSQVQQSIEDCKLSHGMGLHE